jgi:hypothetical protein
MASIGNQITSTSFVVDTFSGTGSQTAFTGLTFAPASTAAISVYVAGVYQSPSSYSLSGTTLNFNSAPAVGSSNIQVLHLGTGATAGVPSDGSVSVAKMAANAITTSSIADANVTDAKIVAVANTKITGLVTASQGGTGASSLAGANIAVTSAASSFTAKQTFTGSTSSLASAFINATESANVSATAATGTINFDITTASVLYYTTDASGNWTLNIRGNATTNANTIMATGDSLTVVFLATQGATPYYNNALTIDGNAITPKYQGGTAYTTGNASGVDAYSYTIVKTGNAAFTVFAAQTQFK